MLDIKELKGMLYYDDSTLRKEGYRMKKENRLSLLVLLILLLTTIGACSNPNEGTSSNTDNKNESKETSSTPTEENSNDSKVTNEDDETSTTNSESELEEENQNEDNSTENNDKSVNESTSGEKEENPVTSDQENKVKNFDLDQYLNTNYMIDGVHYKTKSFGKIEGTDRIDYKVDIVPDTKGVGEEINKIFKKGTPYDNERTAAMMNIARNILKDLPVINEKVHIDSVNWVSYDGEYEVMLIQDFEKSTIKDR
jgi:hypothetical protein